MRIINGFGVGTGTTSGDMFKMEFRTGVPDRFDNVDRGPGFRIEFRQLAPNEECSSRRRISHRSSGRARWNRMQVFASN